MVAPSRSPLAIALVLLSFAGAASGQIGVPSDGSDGRYAPTAVNDTIDLSLAAKAPWNTPAPIPGRGVYDSTMWAVVFKYSSVDIASGRTVRFKNHPSGAPVVWLVQDTVRVAGTISVNGQNYTSLGPAEPGPGGFRGGQARSSNVAGGAGMGPGGGCYGCSPNGYGGGGSYSTLGQYGSRTYGNAKVLPLIGGSGGGARNEQTSGYAAGGGGGAILIAANQRIRVTGAMTANGGAGSAGSGSGSGGAIRLVANTLLGTAASLSAVSTAGGSFGGAGRIRIEANDATGWTGSSNPISVPVPVDAGGAVIWPPSGSPTLRVVSVGGVPVPLDPNAEFTSAYDVLLSSTGPVPAVLEATNMPTNWIVKALLTRRSGAADSVTAAYSSGDSVSSTWTATLPALPLADFVAIQARAFQPGP